MNVFHLAKTKSPQESQATAADVSPPKRTRGHLQDRSKRMAMAVPPEEVEKLRKSIDEGVAPMAAARTSGDPSAANPNLRQTLGSQAKNGSTVSLLSPPQSTSIIKRRKSAPSLEPLAASAVPSRGSSRKMLPPSPGIANVGAVRRFSQWSDEAGSKQERAQRVRVLKLLVQAAQNKLCELHIGDFELITDLPAALRDLDDLKTLRLTQLTRLTQTLDLHELKHLERVDIEACPNLRVAVAASCDVFLDGVRQAVQGGYVQTPQGGPAAVPASKSQTPTRRRGLKALFLRS